MDIELIITPNFFKFGFDWFSKDELFDFNEVNVYFAFINLKITWE